MSHTLGVMCAYCHAILEDGDPCPERDCPGGHGFTNQYASPWAAKTWPEHACFLGKE